MTLPRRFGPSAWSVALALAALLLVPAVARAAEFPLPQQLPTRASTFDDYRRRVDEAHLNVERASPSAWRDVRQTQDLAARLNTLLPGTERVIVDGKTISTDNSILRTYITRLDDEGLDVEARREALRGVARHLASLKLAVDEASGRRVPGDPALLRSLLSQADLSSRQSLIQLLGGWLDAIAKRLAEWFSHLGGGGPVTASDVALGIVLVALATLFIALVVYVVRGLSGALARHDEAYLAEVAGIPVVAAAEGLPADVLTYAEGLAADGRFREATRALFGGAARALVQLGLLRSTGTRTNAELLRDLAPVASPVVPPLSDLSARFERAWYGHADPGAGGFEEARARYGETLRAAGRIGREEPGEAAVAAPDARGARGEAPAEGRGAGPGDAS